MAEISETETIFLDTNIYKGERFRSKSVRDVCKHFKPSEAYFNIRASLHATLEGSKKTSSNARLWLFSEQTLLKKIFEEQIQNLKSSLRESDYPENLVQRTLSEVQF